MSLAACDLRRSCTFCRQRKMKCTGESPWCKSCKERAQPCVYETSIPKSRPQRSTDPSLDFPYPGFDHARMFPALTALSLDHFEDILNGLYATLWDWRGRLSAKYETFRADASMSSNSGFATLPFEATLMLMFYETAEMLVEKISPLGRAGLFADGPARFVVALANDSTNTMFDAESSQHARIPRDAATELDQRRMTDLIEIAYAEHPFLSIISSKTLFIREFLAETHDRCLLHVILGEAIALVKISQAASLSSTRAGELDISPDAYIAQAIELLQMRKRRSTDDQAQLTTLQAVVLLAWHMLYTGRIKRSLTLFGLAIEMIRRALAGREFDSATSSRINGIATDEIDEEMLYSMHWIVQSVILWASLHLDVAIAEILGPSLQGYYPPLDLNGSKVWMLDAISGSLSAVRRQASAIKCVRILSHGYGLASSIYNLIRPDEHSSGGGGEAARTTQRGGRQLWRSASVVEQLHVCLPRIYEEAVGAVPPTHRELEGYVAVQIYHELLALRILLEAPTLRDSNSWAPGIFITYTMAARIIDLCGSLAVEAVNMSTKGPTAEATDGLNRQDRLHREELLYSAVGGEPPWCTALMVLALDTSARALEILLTKAGFVAGSGALPSDIELTYHLDDEARRIVCVEAGRIAWILSRYCESLRSASLECRLRRDIKRHCKALVHALKLRGVDEVRPPMSKDPLDVEGMFTSHLQSSVPHQHHRHQPHHHVQDRFVDVGAEPAAPLYDYPHPSLGDSGAGTDYPPAATSVYPKEEKMDDVRSVEQPRGFNLIPAGRLDSWWRDFRSDDDMGDSQLPFGVACAPRRNTISTMGGQGGETSPSQRFHSLSRAESGAAYPDLDRIDSRALRHAHANYAHHTSCYADLGGGGDSGGPEASHDNNSSESHVDPDAANSNSNNHDISSNSAVVGHSNASDPRESSSGRLWTDTASTMPQPHFHHYQHQHHLYTSRDPPPLPQPNGYPASSFAMATASAAAMGLDGSILSDEATAQVGHAHPVSLSLSGMVETTWWSSNNSGVVGGAAATFGTTAATMAAASRLRGSLPSNSASRNSSSSISLSISSFSTSNGSGVGSGSSGGEGGLPHPYSAGGRPEDDHLGEDGLVANSATAEAATTTTDTTTSTVATAAVALPHAS